MTPRHRLGTADDLERLPSLLVGFGARPVPEEADEQEDEAGEGEDE